MIYRCYLENNMKIKISDIFHVKTGIRIREEDVYSHKGNIPCITAQTVNNGVAWTADISWLETFSKKNESLLFNEPCVTWSKDGYAGKLFYRNNKFFPNDHCGVLLLKEEYKKDINLAWFVNTQQSLIMSKSLQSNSQPMLYNEQMSNIEFELPIQSDGSIDINLQNNLVKLYDKVKQYKKVIEKELLKVNNILSKELIIDNYITKTVEDIALLNKGSNKISEENIYNNHSNNGIPVYSSATLNEGLMGEVNNLLYKKSNKKGKAGELTWTTNGYAGVVFYRETDYLYSEKCGRIILRKKYKKIINLKFLKIYLNQITYKYKTAESNNGKLDILHMSNIPVKLPINNHGEIDIKIQNLIVKKYEKIFNIKTNLEKILVKCNNKLDT